MADIRRGPVTPLLEIQDGCGLDYRLIMVVPSSLDIRGKILLCGARGVEQTSLHPRRHCH